MGRKNFTPEQIIKHLLGAGILLGKKVPIGLTCKKLGIMSRPATAGAGNMVECRGFRTLAPEAAKPRYGVLSLTLRVVQ